MGNVAANSSVLVSALGIDVIIIIIIISCIISRLCIVINPLLMLSLW